MSVTTPTTLTITKHQDLLGGPMRAAELRTALNNSNHLYGYFCPNLASFQPFGGLSSATKVYLVPVIPSKDGLSYDFVYSFKPTATGTVTLQVDTNTGANPTTGWTTVYGPTATSSMTAGAWVQHKHTMAIAVGVTILRITLSSPAGTYILGHVAVKPTRLTSLAGLVHTSGFVPVDDAFLTASGAPITTEHVSRAKANALAILTDRAQCLASYVQPYNTATGIVGSATAFTAAAAGTGIYQVTAPGSSSVTKTVGVALASTPYQTKLNATVFCIASVSGGPGASLIRVRVTAPAPYNKQFSVNLAASGNLETAHLTGLISDGTLRASLKFEVDAKASVGHSTYIHSLFVLWQPGS